mmetsp:Transcript_4745/g.8115  ORF Transcript_4745/g.8115 Transcript_4745/m.8115 type:complete len:357 (-) Transcript_4745:224-1294(-)|eukprot:CAMPEP_0168616526 /NCGR_PEP_ID=MMETSP0449_2-20121227/5072_1 /TAXON_ID=1082188 /ORGANISM="Strombidium rassoulzadegani, Strain ras09" /LENGTH=356 /DNA_ID=CAMNT_0008657313 /DNA_START=402 /DNA_END=1472 /DNA_ORIENTATION=-
MTAGGFSVFGPKYLNEVAPLEISGPIGTITQISVTLGILFPCLIGTLFPDLQDLEKDKVLINIVFSIPIGFAVLQILLMVTIFKYDTPHALKEKGDFKNLSLFMKKLYKPAEVQKRIDLISVEEKRKDTLRSHHMMMAEDSSKEQKMTYGRVCCSLEYRKATFVGCTLSMFQQLTGINFIMLYSNLLFKDMGLSPQYITGLGGTVNFLTCFGGLILLTKFGRRSIMVTTNYGIALVLILSGFFSIQKLNSLSIATTMIFIALFEFGPGPILVIYCSEILTDIGMSLALVMNWTVNLAISLITPSLINAIGTDNIGYIFIVMGCLTFLGATFMVKFMKETKGKSKAEIAQLFSDVPK